MVDPIIISIILFAIAAFFEISGAYFVYKWLKEKKTPIIGILGGLILFFYGITQTFQLANFGRTYAAYGGIFVISTLIWGAIVDRKKPDKYEIIGMIVILLGVIIIFFIPR
jgi:small multidrug resistance family-3 protein